MKCPVCPATDLLMTTREGVEIDYCPHCRGVWLDRGELNQIIRRGSLVVEESRHERDRPVRGLHHDDHRHSDSGGRRLHSRRKKSFPGDLFDFD